MSGRFDRRVAIVTGAARGIGAATARRLAAGGSLVVVTDVDATAGEAVAEAIVESGGLGVFHTLDVADAAAWTAVVERVASEIGTVDILVNNAGIAVFDDPLALTDERWRRCFEVDLDGVWFGIRSVLPAMLDKGTGSIVNVASVHASQIIPGCFPYPVAKHAVVGLTRALAIEYAPRGIRVNAVSPSYVDTQVTRDYLETFPDPAAERRRVEAIHPMRRIGQPEEVAAAIAFLAGDECPFITGANLAIDGGRSLLFHDVP